MPEQKPRMEACPLWINSMTAQAKPAVAVARVVVVKALAATPSAATAEPALNPYQPTQSMPVPTMHSTMLCGCHLVFAEAQALAEDQAEDQRAPSPRSCAPRCRRRSRWHGWEAVAFQTPFIRPVEPQTMWAMGK